MPENVVTAAEMEMLSPAERRAVFESSIIDDLDDAPRHLVERARLRTQQRAAASELQRG